MLPEGVARAAAVGRHPLGHARQTVERGHGMRQLVRLPWREAEGDGPSLAVGDHAGLGAVAAARAAERLTPVALRRSAPFRAAPAAFWCARTSVPSRNVMPSCTPRSRA